MSVVANLAAERARRGIDSLLDRIERIRRELSRAPTAQTTDRLRDLADRLAEVGITMLAATVVMREDLDRRFRDLQRRRPRSRFVPSQETDQSTGRGER
jgi:NTP pyrophosphatase (non-canonical NTP hydrolase)